ncbi:MAG: hypothetical protein FWG33_00300 [Oscillospiraceae bacterium]|nr:hypothetical protein [Oscillospiraceae bacterium]
MEEQEVMVDEIIEDEIVEEVNIAALVAEEESEIPSETAANPPETVKRKISFGLIFALAAVVIATAALIFSLAKTDLTIGQGELFVQGGIVNELLGNLIRNDLAAKVPEEVNVRGINIKVILYGSDESETARYAKVSDIGESDSVSAEIVFFPQESVEAFARDCRAMLDIMTESDIVYDEISFLGEDRRTAIHADLSGRFSMDISIEEIMDITFYFGEVDN